MSARRIQIAASEVLGMRGTGGAATADSLLALALARHGHDVELLVAPGRSAHPLTEPWAGLYSRTGVQVTRLEPRHAVRPSYLVPTASVLEAARSSAPDVLIADDWRGLAWASLRARELGLGLERTAVVLYCHGPARMLAEFARKVPDTLARFGEEVAERSALRLADAAASPSAWLFAWQRERGWPPAPAPRVVPCLWRSVALDEVALRAETAAPIRRLAFFGQLREGKGVRIFLESLTALGSALDGVEVLFLGRETRRWTAARVCAALPAKTRARLSSLRFEPNLDPTEALAELRVRGTLAVMPSLLDNSPYTVSECLEHGVPFLAARTGGIPELVAESDHERVLFEPTSAHLTRALRRALRSPDGVEPASPGFDPRSALEEWLELVEQIEPARRRPSPRIEAVTVVTPARSKLRPRFHASGLKVEHIEAESRADGLARATHEWLVFLDRDDEPDDGLLDALVDAQARSGADAVTTGVRPADAPDGVQLFLGDPDALGLIENQYGVVALVRRALVGEDELAGASVDPDWPMLAALALRGARIVSLPEVHATHRGRPGRVTDVPGEGLTVLRLFEVLGGDRRRSEALVTALAAELARARSVAAAASGNRLRRAVGALRRKGRDAVVGRVRRPRRAP